MKVSRSQHLTNVTKDKPMIKVVPNPADNKIDIKVSKHLEGICKIEIWNALGALVLSEEKNCKEKSFSIQTSYLNPGVYSVKVSTAMYSSSIVKLIIVR